jgi:hypothetical protein
MVLLLLLLASISIHCSKNEQLLKKINIVPHTTLKNRLKNKDSCRRLAFIINMQVSKLQMYVSETYQYFLKVFLEYLAC